MVDGLNVWFDGEKGYTYNYLKLILLKVHGFHIVTNSKNSYLKNTVEFANFMNFRCF